MPPIQPIGQRCVDMGCGLKNKAPSAPGPGLPLSHLPPSLRPSARNLIAELDADGDGFLNENTLTMAINTRED